MSCRPHDKPVATHQLLGHTQVVIDAQERLTALLLQNWLESARLMHERTRPALIVELRGEHFAVPNEVVVAECAIRRAADLVHATTKGVVRVIELHAVGPQNAA